MKKHNLAVMAAAIVLMLLSSCVIWVRGDVYIAYGWDDGVTAVYDSNPTFQDNSIVEDTYYRSDVGDYYGSYRTKYLKQFVFSYRLYANYSSIGNYYDPYDSYFYLYLSDAGPQFQGPAYSRSLGGEKGSGRQIDKASAPGIDAVPSRENLGEPTGVMEETKNGYTLHLEYWKIEP